VWPIPSSRNLGFLEQSRYFFFEVAPHCTVDSRLSARGLTAFRLNRGNVFLKKKFYFP
jgi:hypothetical protein